MGTLREGHGYTQDFGPALRILRPLTRAERRRFVKAADLVRAYREAFEDDSSPVELLPVLWERMQHTLSPLEASGAVKWEY